MRTPQDHANTLTPPIERPRQLKYILCYTGFILLPLALCIAYLCYDKGISRDFGPVTVTHKFDYIKANTMQSSGVRGGGNSTNTSYRWKYQVWGETETGQMCFIEVNDLLSFNRYTKGEVVETAYTFHKARGEWRWTTMAEFFLKIWVSAFLILLIRLWYRSPFSNSTTAE